MPSNHHLVSFDLIHSIKNGKGKKNVNFRRGFHTLDDYFFGCNFFVKMHHFEEKGESKKDSALSWHMS